MVPELRHVRYVRHQGQHLGSMGSGCLVPGPSRRDGCSAAGARCSPLEYWTSRLLTAYVGHHLTLLPVLALALAPATLEPVNQDEYKLLRNERTAGVYEKDEA